jgi:hypothetical protein
MLEYRLVVTYAANGEFCYEIREVSNDLKGNLLLLPSCSFWIDYDADFSEGISMLRKEFEMAVSKPSIFQEYDRATGEWNLREGKNES